MKKMSDYHDLYLKTDVLLLKDVFEKFIKTCLEYYGLDPCHCFSCLGLSWVATLMTGGISYIAKRHSKANNKYMENYDSSESNSIEESVFIIYLDANNLYGWAMIQYLPYGGFKWLSKKEIDEFDLNLVKENTSTIFWIICIMIIH